MRTSRALFMLGLLLLLLLLIAHLAGLRQHTAIISGMLPERPEDAALGIGYALSWFLGVLLAPILLLAALLRRLMGGAR